MKMIIFESLKNLLKKRQRRLKKFTIAICPHIGDSLYSLGYINSFKKQKMLDDINVYGCETIKPLISCYQNLNIHYKVKSSIYLSFVSELTRFKIFRFLYKMNNFMVVEAANNFLEGFYTINKFPDASFKDCIRYGCFGLDSAEEPELPVLKKKVSKMNKTIFLCFDSNSIELKRKNKYLYALKNKLIHEGYNVIVNSEKFGLERTFELFHSVDAVIGVRSGLLDLAMCTEAFVIALYPKGYEYCDFFDINDINVKKKNCVQYMCKESVKVDISKICELVKAEEML